ncbi:DNA-directed RNA polymerase III subunit C1 [Atractiella rhizophila]|nr:DNA-directed RNA polymerase III subunit C1 [Atractiella rhizophila]
MKELVVDDAPKRIKHIQFTPLAPSEIVALSEYESTTRDLYTFPDRQPATHGVLDKRLGTSMKNEICETCQRVMSDCTGHYSYIKLVLPVFHIGYLKATMQMCQCVCKTCARVLLPENQRRQYLARFRRPGLDSLTRTNLLRTVYGLCRKTLICPHCHALNGTIKKVGPLKIIHEKFKLKKRGEVAEAWEEFKHTFDLAKGEMKEIESSLERAEEDLNPLRVLELFRRISDTDCELLGMDPTRGRPEDFIWQYIHVPPVCIRPSVAQDGSTNEDDLTVKLTEIIFTNSLIKAGLSKGTTTSSLMEQWEFLALSAAMYINSETPGIPTGAGIKPIRGYCQRLKGKQGRFRGNLSGKRVDFSGRTVISPDPNLPIDHVAVPEKVAKVLTYPERVTDHNIERLRRVVRNGSDVHPGANFVQQGSGGVKRFLRYAPREEIAAKLRVGDIVERHLHDGDIVLFNRQPSLHKLSIMSHVAKIRPWRTFRFNECVCTPYNADFDGDEMNLHVPQTEESRTEAFTLMNIRHNLVTPRNGEPIIAATQDFITASFLISRKDTFFDRAQFTHILNYMDDAREHFDLPPPTIWKPYYLWTGKQVFNCLMRPNKKSPVLLNLELKCKEHHKAKAGDAPDMSPNDGYLVIRNSEIMCGVMDKNTVGGGKKNSVFGVMLRDFGEDVAAKAMSKLAKLSARWLANRGFSIGISDVTPGESLRNQKDKLIQKAYDEANQTIEDSRSGKLENQPGCDRDQTLEAVMIGTLSRVREKLGDTCMEELTRQNAPLIMAICGSKGSKINVSQMVACVGQQVISGKRVPDGFQDRSLPHFPKMSKDPPSKGFVRNSFFSGLTATEFLFHAISGREGLVDTAVKTAETGYMQRRLMKALEDLSTRYDLSVRNSTGGIVQFTYGDDGLDPTYLEGETNPVDFERSWKHIMSSIPRAAAAGLLPYEILDILDDQLSQQRFTASCTIAFIDSIRQFIKKTVVDKAVSYRQAYGMSAGLIRDEVADDAKENDLEVGARKIVDNKTKVTSMHIRKFLDLCWYKYIKCKIEPGTAVGAVGAQSIGEPGTQMTLKTFHFAGVASMNITLGVPRIKEIINASKKISTPIITAKLVSQFSEHAARIVKGRIEQTYLGDIAAILEDCYHDQHLYLSVHIDRDAIRKLQLEVTLDSIRDSIISAPKLKIGASQVHVVSKKGRIRVYCEGGAKGETAHARMMYLRRALPKVVVKGFPSLARAVIKTVDEDQSKELLVEGYGFRDVMVTDGVVGTKTTSNHIMDVKAVLGIEAARSSIIDQISYTMASHNLGVDPRHMMLLGDIMCYKGEVLGITRFGVARMKDSVLMLASFEKTTDHLFDSSLYSKKDAISGVSECIIVGAPANNCGTAMPSLVTKKVQLPKGRTLLFEDYRNAEWS